MRDITLVTNQDYGLREIEQELRKFPNGKFLRPEETLKVISGHDSVTVEFKIPTEFFGVQIIIDKANNDEMKESYEPEIMAKFKTTISQPQFFIIRFHNIEYAKILLRYLVVPE